MMMFRVVLVTEKDIQVLLLSDGKLPDGNNNLPEVEPMQVLDNQRLDGSQLGLNSIGAHHWGSKPAMCLTHGPKLWAVKLHRVSVGVWLVPIGVRAGDVKGVC